MMKFRISTLINDISASVTSVDVNMSLNEVLAC